MKLLISFTSMYGYITTAIDDAVVSFGTGLVTFVAAPLALAATIYFLLLGFAVLRGAVQSPMRELVFQAGKVGFVIAAASSVGYSTFVVNIVNKLPDEIIAAGSGQKVDNPGTTFDNYVSDSNKVATPIVAANDRVQSQPVSAFDLGLVVEKIQSGIVTMLTVLIIYIFSGISAAIGFCIVIYAKFAVAICVALGPLALACLLFDSSRWFFDGWLHQTVNYMLLMVIMAIMTKFVIGLETHVMDDLMGAIGNGESFVLHLDKMVINAVVVLTALLASTLIYLVGTIFFLQAPSIAAGIAGGSASGGHGFLQSGASMAINKLMSKSGKGGGKGGGGGGGGGKVSRSR